MRKNVNGNLIKPLRDRLYAELRLTDVDPELIMTIVKEWGDDFIKGGIYHDNAATWACLKDSMNKGE